MDALKALSEIQGVKAWALVGEDGSILEDFQLNQALASKLLSDPGPSAFAAARAVADELGMGPLEELMVEYPEGSILMVPTKKGPMLIVLLDQLSSLGRVRVVLKKILPLLEKGRA